MCIYNNEHHLQNQLSSNDAGLNTLQVLTNRAFVVVHVEFTKKKSATVYQPPYWISGHLTHELVVLSGREQGGFTCRLSSPHCCSEQQQQHISVSAFACYAKTRRGKKTKKKNSNNVCWRRGAEAITENTFRQIANMRSKVTVESEGSNITAIWLIAAPLVTEASHRRRTNSRGEQRGRKTSSLAR